MTITTVPTTPVAPAGAPSAPSSAAWRGLPAVVAERARLEADRVVLTALDHDGDVAATTTAAELDRSARALAVGLQEVAAPGDRVLVPSMPGLDFHRAFLACLYGGFVAVPVPPIRVGGLRRTDPRAARRLGRLIAICGDATPVAAFVPERDVAALREVLGGAGAAHPALSGVHLLSATPPADVDPDRLELLPGEVLTDPATTAFLQYTSGSTSAPRGVVVSHGALVHNQQVVASRYAIGPDTTTVSWLPTYHDMGLCAGLLQPLHTGGTAVVMEPETFLVRPQRWLEALSGLADAVTAAPDFAYLLAAARVTPEVKEGLDLRGWRMALCGAEPVKASTVRLFTRAFAGCGLRPTALTPAYGLAESTLFVSGNDVAQPAFVRSYDREALGRGVAVAAGETGGVELVGAGREGDGIQVAIVEPETGTPCADGVVGELWVRSPSNGDGYWRRPEESQAMFRAEPVGLPRSDGGWLRTGDLGFRDDGELVITGRLKDLVIIRGVNYYPQDFERIAQSAHPALGLGLAAAFVDDANPDRVRVVVEADRRTPHDVLSAAAAEAGRAVTVELPVQVEVLLVDRGRVPRTTSGKVRRKECALRIADVELLARWPRHD